jgi:hypothetical protein
MVVKIQSPHEYNIEPWQMLGHLGATLEAEGKITPDDWNAAIESHRRRCSSVSPLMSHRCVEDSGHTGDHYDPELGTWCES